jgi:tetrahedral aminopeptidase
MDRKRLIERQAALCDLIGCPGYEDEVAAYLVDAIRPLVDEVRRDGLGSVLAVKRGAAKDAARLLLDAHMDEVGFMVSAVDDRGFLRIVPLGGIDRALMPGAQLVFAAAAGARVHGVVGTLPPHVTGPEERGKAPDFPDLYVDVGASSADEVAAMGLRMGSTGTFDTPFRTLGDRLVMARALDDRTACNIVLAVLEELAAAPPEATILVCFSSQEEVGARGATAAAFALEPDVAVAIENTTATDTPGVGPDKVVSRLGGGPVLTMADNSLIVPGALLERQVQAAAKAGVPFQYKRPIYGGTDGGRIALTRGGVPTCVVSVPCRYIHGPAGIASLDDVEATVRLVTALCRQSWKRGPAPAWRPQPLRPGRKDGRG